jgi:hypothetical protein
LSRFDLIVLDSVFAHIGPSSCFAHDGLLSSFCRMIWLWDSWMDVGETSVWAFRTFVGVARLDFIVVVDGEKLSVPLVEDPFVKGVDH